MKYIMHQFITTEMDAMISLYRILFFWKNNPAGKFCNTTSELDDN